MGGGMYKEYGDAIWDDDLVIQGVENAERHGISGDEFEDIFLKPVAEEVLSAKKAYRGIPYDDIPLDRFIAGLKKNTPIGRSWTYDRDIARKFASTWGQSMKHAVKSERSGQGFIFELDIGKEKNAVDIPYSVGINILWATTEGMKGYYSYGIETERELRFASEKLCISRVCDIHDRCKRVSMCFLNEDKE